MEGFRNMIVEGKLTGSSEAYSGHSVELGGEFSLGEDSALASLLLRAAVASDGSFTIEFPAHAVLKRNAELTVRAPDGHRLYRGMVNPSAPVELDVAPSLPVELELPDDPFAASLGPIPLRVVVQDRLANEPSAAALVSIWGLLAANEGATAAAPLRTILAADYTDSAGAVRLSIARARYKSLEVELPGARSGIELHAIALDGDGLPPRVVRIAADVASSKPATDGGACGPCNSSQLPRTPEHEDLVETGVYSTDLANGRCPSPAVANRTLEEYQYYSLVRTTDPYLFGVKAKRPERLSPMAIGKLAELAYGFDTMDSSLGRGAESNAGSLSNERGSTLDSARKSSEAYFSSGLIAARAWRDAADAGDVKKAIMERAETLSEDTLRHALADPDGFTPVNLMTAERMSAIDSVKHKLRLFHDASKGRELVSTDNMPTWDRSDTASQASTIAHGHILEWRQVWRADGYSLGDLVYSLPLAPGQKRKVAVLDWDRGEGSFKTESRNFSESFSANLGRERTVSEVVKSTVSESMRAGSNTNTWAAGGGIGLGIPFGGGFFGLGVAGGGGGASSSSWQNNARSLSASAGQQLSDRTAQASKAVRSQRSAIVVGAQQSESLAVTSEVVANYNHCHAMTVEYFEVLQHFRVDQELATVRECLFIPLSMRPFNIWRAARWRDILKPRLRRKRWSKGFAAIERTLRGYVDSGFPPGRYADEDVTELSGNLRLELSIARPRDIREDEAIDDYLNNVWDFWKQMFGGTSANKAYDATIDDRDLAEKVFANEYAPRAARAFCEGLTVTLVVEHPTTGSTYNVPLPCDFTMVSRYRGGSTHLVSFRALSVPAGITRAAIRAIRIGSSSDRLSPNSTTVLRRATVHYATEYRRHALVSNLAKRDDILDGDDAQITTRSLSRSEERNPREEDREAISGLLKHVNEFNEYYHQIIWWRMDPNRRFMLLDGFTAPNSGGRSLASVVENRLISIVGNALVMPVAPGYQLDPLIKGDKAVDLKQAYQPVTPFAPKRISLPTRGVHAEAILGECNSCELKDDTRFWDWASEPIPNNDPTQIGEISTRSRRQEPADVTPSPLAAPIVAIQNAPAAPNPTSVGALAELLGKSGLFKDITGLEGNQKNAIAAFQQSLKTANAFGKMAASGAKASFANRNSERVMRKVDEAKRSGVLKDQDAKDVVSKLFGVMNGESKDSDQPLSEDGVVKEALEAVNKTPGDKKVSIKSSSGSTSQSVDAEFSGAEGASPTIDHQLVGIPPLKQPSPLSCWAVALTMLESDKRKQSLPVETVLLAGGQQYVDLYRADTGLKIEQLRSFRSDFRLKDISFGALTAESIEGALKQFGPLWVIADEDSTAGFSIHARVVTGIRGDGSVLGTQIIYNDPALGKEQKETLKSFAEKVAQLSNGMRSSFGGVSPTVLAR